MNKFIVFFCCLTFPFLIYAQDLPFKNFSHTDGLPSTEVYDIFQDKNGCMWFATDRGIAQYNGYEFKTYETAHGLSDICVFDFFLQPNGQVWCSTHTNKIFYFENGKNKFIPYKYNRLIEKYFENIHNKMFIIKKILVDEDKTVYITDFNHTIKIDAKGKLTVIENLEKYKKGDNILGLQSLQLKNKVRLEYFSLKKSSRNIYENLSGRLGLVSISPNKQLIASGPEINIYTNNKKATNLHFPNMDFIECGIYKKNLFWIGYRSKGVKIFNENGKEIQHLLKNYSVTKLFLDCYDGIWISTLEAGVFYLKKNLIHTNNLKNSPVNSLSVDNKDNIFVGGYDGNIYAKNYFEKSYKTLIKSITNFPSYVAHHHVTKQNYFIANNQLFYNGNIFDPKKFIKLTDDKESNSLLLFAYNSIKLFDPDSKRIKETEFKFKILDVCKVNENYFVGTLFGLKKIHNSENYSFKNSIFNSRIEDIDYEKNKQTLYIASLGKGIIVYNLKTNKAYSIDKSKGLSSNLVNEVFIQNETTIWACTNYGLNKITFTKKGNFEIKYITTGNGLPINQIKKVQTLKDSIYIGTSKGLSTFALKDFDDLFKNKKYFLKLKEIKVNNQEIGLQNNLKLAYDENDLTFFVEGVSFNSNSQMFYKYKMQGLDKEWHYTKDRKIVYQYLPPGEYTFRVQISEDNKVLSKEEISLSLRIFEPFWKTNWFILLIISIIGAMIYLFFKIRVFTYNVDIVRELLRLLVRKFTKKEMYYTFREQGNEVRVKTQSILYVKSSGNYIELVTLNKSYIIRAKISDFIGDVPDPLEFLRIHRSYIVRIDKIEKKTKKSVFIKHEEIPVGETYFEVLNQIIF